MTLEETKGLIAFARTQHVQELSVGDVHVLFAPGAQVAAVPSREIKPVMIPQDDGDEGAAAVMQLMDDPDLFLSSDGGPVVPQ